jgi:hypothetical protein
MGGLTFEEWESNFSNVKNKSKGIPILNEINQVFQHINPIIILLFVPSPMNIVVANGAPSNTCPLSVEQLLNFQDSMF